MGRGWCPLVACVLVGVVGCSIPSEPDTTLGSEAPEFRVKGDGAEVVLPAWTYCVPGVCADGAPPDQPPSVGSPASVLITFSRPGWTLEARFARPGEDCWIAAPGSVTAIDPTHWRLESTGRSGPHDVTLSALSPTEGDAHATFRWVTVPTGSNRRAEAPCS